MTSNIAILGILHACDVGTRFPSSSIIGPSMATGVLFLFMRDSNTKVRCYSISKLAAIKKLFRSVAYMHDLYLTLNDVKWKKKRSNNH